MRSYVRLALVALPLLALVASPVVAHDHCGRHQGCPDCPGGRAVGGGVYDPDTVTTLRGTVTAITVVPARDGRIGGTHLTLESEGTVTETHLGPTWFLEREGVTLSKGDALEVTGSVVDSGGATFLVAREVKRGAKVLRLRDERGLPLWAGGARRP